MVPNKREEKQKKENENVKEIQKRWEKGIYVGGVDCGFGYFGDFGSAAGTDINWRNKS